ncbi:hypothetical protein H6G74_01360 [Nostoc spongiaeforme FACHB-130]|uniref:Transposase n=1 Tax=Nostoc spongiaeforme FACHB-130 TaxID=1357510 RepID=A0ABR8FRK9_9NOSO|nr:hypothetical protein [Nostoc spongiaeforme]MBD2592975.1 hypothetical protein [Nostoc spongiaeforme FACHB-130]
MKSVFVADLNVSYSMKLADRQIFPRQKDGYSDIAAINNAIALVIVN